MSDHAFELVPAPTAIAGSPLRKIVAWHLGIAGKFWLVASLTLLTILLLAVQALRLAEVTRSASRHVQIQVLGGITTATELEILLERHRRLVESAPAEVDRKQLDHDQLNAMSVETELEGLLASGEWDLIEIIEDVLPRLRVLRRQVFLFAANLAQDKASVVAAEYNAAATAAAKRSFDYRALRARDTAAWARQTIATADAFQWWLWLSLGAMLITLGPLGLSMIHNMISRLVSLRAIIMRLAGNETNIEVPGTNDGDEVGDIARAITVFKANAIALLDNDARLARLNRQFDAALNNMTHGLCMLDGEQRVVITNMRFRELYRLSADDAAPGTTMRDMVEGRIAAGFYAGNSPDEYRKRLLRPTTETSVEVHHYIDGRSISISRSPMLDGGWVTIHEDITDSQHAARRIAHMATHDALTNLANRVLLRERLDNEIARCRRGRGMALLSLDLDRFKAVNDTLGHPIGDALLQAVADRLRQNVREIDTVARLGGDEFAVLQTDADCPEFALGLAQRLISVISAPYAISGHAIEIGTSIGIALAPRDSSDADELIKCADMALYRAKENGRGTAVMYEPDFQTQSLARRAIEQDLRHAMASNALELYYQPVVDLETGTVSSVEALLRWKHWERGWVPPMEFVPVAEEAGLIGVLGQWVLETACKAAIRLPPGVKVAVNLSPRQFSAGDVGSQVIDALAVSGLAANRLTLEITESTLLKEDGAVIDTLNRLRSLGVTIMLDDFGTGYSSMSYLRRFPFDGLKIDKSFIRDASSQDDRVAIVNAIVTMAQSLRMKSVAEGVEDAADLELVRAAGCTHVQGYLFSRPVPFDQVITVIAGCRLNEGLAA